MRAKKKTHIFAFVGVLLIVIGSALMLHRVMGERLYAAGAIQLVTGFSSVAVGAMLLTRSGISVFFYFLFVLAIALVQLPVVGFMSFDLLVVLVLLVVGVLMVKALSGRRMRR